MKYLIFSDTHLTDQFDEKTYLFLKKIISDADRVIINGDFWDGYSGIGFGSFIQSEWKKLFPLLKKKQTVYLYGNHDKKKLSDTRVNLFSVKQAYRYLLKSGNRRFWIEHGNKYFPADWEEKFHLPKLTVSLNQIYDILEKALFDLFGKNVQTHFFNLFNKKMQQIVKKIIPQGYIFICGHTHAQEFDLKNRFINTGFNRHGFGQYLLVEDGKLQLKSERYK